MRKIHPLLKCMVIPALLILSSCVKHESLGVTPITYGNIILSFTQKVNGESLRFDTLIYRTSAGNSYQVSDLQYFISGISLHAVNGKWQGINTDDGIHYIDARDNYSCSWWVKDPIPSGTYDTVSFIFGLDPVQNTTGRFPDPPQRDMAWPDILGGGYHYMKMNLKWKNDTMFQSLPFMFHLGIGQIYSGNTVNPDSITGFVNNSFRVFLPCKLGLGAGAYQQIILQMNVDKWFDGEKVFDFAAYPDGIMQNEEAMSKACLNGMQAFSLSVAK